MPFEIIRNDITKVKADAIVNAANAKLQQGGGVCGAIFAAAGAEDLQKECDAIGGCAVGGAVITKGYNLPADYIIHVVGPIWHGGDKNEEALLRNAYNNALGLAKEYGLQSIAFPLISAGIYGYPKEQALKAATQTIQAFLAENDMLVTLVVYDNKAFEISEKLFNSVTQYIEENFEDEYPSPKNRRMMQDFELREMHANENLYEFDMAYFSVNATEITPAFADEKGSRSLEDIKLDETFSTMLLRLIDEKGETDAVVYGRANIDRRLFSKIRNNENYRPSKSTAFALAIALKLNLDETKDLLLRAGMAISHSTYFDVIVEYFIKESNYNIFEINETLFAFEQPLLGM